MPSAADFLARFSDNQPGSTPAPAPTADSFLAKFEGAPAKKSITDTTDKLFGAGEAALAVGSEFTSGAYGYVTGAIGGTLEAIAKGQLGTTEGLDTAGKRAAAGSESLTFEPRGEKGQEYADFINRLIRDSGAMGIDPAMLMRMTPGPTAKQAARGATARAPGEVDPGIAKAEARVPETPSGPPQDRPFPIPPVELTPEQRFDVAQEAARGGAKDAEALRQAHLEDNAGAKAVESPFPAEAGDISAIGAKKPGHTTATDFLDRFEKSPEAEVTEKLARGEELTAEEKAAYPALVELERVKREMAAAREEKAQRLAQAPAVESSEMGQKAPEIAPKTAETVISEKQGGEARSPTPAVDKSLSPIGQLLHDYNEGSEAITTPRDILERVEAMDDVPKKVQKAAAKYRKAIDEDYEEYAGRGDVEPHEEAFMEALEQSERDAEATAEKKLQRSLAAQKRHKEGRRIDVLNDDLPTIAGKLGGLSRQALLDLGHDPKDIDAYFKSAHMTSPAVRAKGGISLETLAEELDQLGYQVRDENGNIDTHKVHDLIDEHISGNRVFTDEGRVEQAQRAAVENALAAAKEEYEKRVDVTKRMLKNDPSRLASKLKGLGMKYASEKRQITGELTGRERAKQEAREKGNYKGKEVIVDGELATVTANPFGRVTVEFVSDGRKKTVDADQVTSAADHAKATEEAAAAKDLEEFGPGTLGANAFLNPKVISGAVSKALRAVLGEPGQYRNFFGPIRDAEQHGVARVERWAAGEGKMIRDAFPTKQAREDLTMRLIKDNAAGLTEQQAAVFRKLQANYEAMLQYIRGAERDVGERAGYSPQIWDLRDKKTREYIEAARAARTDAEFQTKIQKMLAEGDRRGDATSQFMLKRSIPDVIEGMQRGLKPKSLDAADLFETYSRSIATAVERGKTVKSLMELQFDEGESAVIPREQAPRNYVKVDSPELEGFRVHPDIAPAVRVLMESNDPGVITKAWQTLAYTAKRALVSYSFFHPKALFEADIGAGGNPATAKGRIEAALKVYRDAKLGDDIDLGLGAGLKIGAPIEDVLGRDRFKGLFDIGAEYAGKVKLDLPFKIAKEMDEKIQKFTWDYVHTGLKLDTFLRKLGDLREKNLKAEKPISEKEMARQAAEFTNSTFGGLNWERMIDSFDTPIARRVMSSVLSKQGRSLMQSTLFAPDWLVSTMGSWTNALPLAERNALKQNLAQRYLVRSAIVTFSIGNALNYYFTGHSMFDNEPSGKDKSFGARLKAKTEVQLGDGRRVQLAKHFMEMPHAIADPLQFAFNKLNPVVAEPFEQLANRQWLSSTYAPPITTKKDAHPALKRAEHASGKFLPITGRGILDQGASGLGGFFGFPVYGMTAEQKAKAKAER